ncbi:MAG: 2-succinyl-6-hydroxy-2,4-cyclohexadiene-1-carboxylate synthase [Actinomycetota bacterium]|nr:2-succinyl-6-hydroxy-2,4-cyclohexadiene-1-carboxylate synthase [Actinomycetota bacterium]
MSRCTGSYWPGSRIGSPAGGLYYTAAGDERKPPVLFLHGFLGSSADWLDVTAALKDRFLCITADLPGHGTSLGLPPSSYTIEGAARAAIRVLDELGVGRAAIVGYSMGGRLALYLALRHPGRCSALFIESASPGLDRETERAARRVADEERARRLESKDFAGFLEGWYRQPLFSSLARDRELLRRTIEMRRRNDPEELARALRGMGTGAQPSLWRELPGLVVPVLATVGELDEKFVEVSRLMAGASPSVSAAVVSGVGHNVHAEAPEVYLDLLEDFLGNPARLERGRRS